MRLLRGFFFLNVAMAVVNASSYGFQLLASHGLSVAGYGEWSACLSFYQIAYVPGLTVTLVVARRVAELAEREASASYIHVMARRLTLFLAGALALLLAAAPLGHRLMPAVSIWVPVLLAVATISNLALPLPLGILQGFRRFGQLSVVTALGSVLMLLLGGLLLAAGAGLPGVVAGVALANLGQIAASLAIFARRTGSSRRTTATSARTAAVPENYLVVTFTYAFVFVMLYADTLLAQQFLGAEEAGRYAVVAVASRIVFFAPYAVITMAVPHLAVQRATGRDTRPFLIYGFLLTLAATLPIVGVYAAAPHLLLRFFFGRAYASSAVAELLPRYAAATALLTLSFFLVHYFMACRRFVYPFALCAGLAALGLSFAISHAHPSDLVRAVFLGNGVTAVLLTGLAVATSLQRPRLRAPARRVVMPAARQLGGDSP